MLQSRSRGMQHPTKIIIPLPSHHSSLRSFAGICQFLGHDPLQTDGGRQLSAPDSQPSAGGSAALGTAKGTAGSLARHSLRQWPRVT